MNKRTKRNFTLIELLVVMLLMGVLMTLMLPAFKRMISGNKVEQLASNLKLGLEQAQSHAITSRRYVALILPNPAMLTSTKLNQDQWFGGCRLAYVNKKRSRNEGKWDVYWEFTDWVPDLDWRVPIDGAMLLWVLNEGGDTSSPPPGGHKYNDFKAGEALSDAPASAEAGTVKFPNLISIEKYRPNPDIKTEYDVDNVAIIFSPYGGIVGNPEKDKSEESYGNLRLVVVEALASDGRSGSLVYPSRDNSNKPTNYMILEINRFTGRTKYYPLPED